tara:strand:- start:205 stop:630 length:426 start_codon:yes stop_codon:yes gene_type:complete
MTLYEDILYILVSFLGMIWLIWIFLRYVSLDVKEKNVAKKVWQQDVIRKNNSNDDIRIFEQGKEYYQKIEHDIDNYQEQKRQIKPRIVKGGSATSTITTPKEIEKIKRCFCRRIGNYECSDCGDIVCSWHMCTCEEADSDC